MPRNMSRKKFALIVACIRYILRFCVIILKIGLLNFWNLIYIIPLILAIVVYLLNKAAKKKMNTIKSVFSPTGTVRNVDCLIIGEKIDAKSVVNCENTVEINTPNASLASSYELLRHTFSILKDGGTAIIAVKKSKASADDFSVFAVPFFHDITLTRLKLRALRRKSKYPMIYYPIETLQFLFGKRKSKFKIVKPDSVIAEFCVDRDIKLIVVYS